MRRRPSDRGRLSCDRVHGVSRAAKRCFAPTERPRESAESEIAHWRDPELFEVKSRSVCKSDRESSLAFG